MSMENETGQVADNMQKYFNYKEQFERLKKAINGKFYLEAAFIEYAFIEDRTEAILLHSGRYDAYIKSRKGHQVTLDSKAKYIKHMAEAKGDLSHKYFSDELLDKILLWKEERNKLVHALLKQVLTTGDVEKVALEGEKYVKALNKKTNSYKRALKKAKLEASQ